MAVVQDLVACHQVHCHVEFGVSGVEISKISTGHYRLHSRHRFGFAGVDRDDPGVRVW